jgi:hypothetical protein
MRGDQQQARSLHEESLKLSLELGDKLIAAESLEGLACSAARGEEERAARLFGAAETLREAVAYNQAPRERERERERCGNRSWAPHAPGWRRRRGRQRGLKDGP